MILLVSAQSIASSKILKLHHNCEKPAIFPTQIYFTFVLRTVFFWIYCSRNAFQKSQSNLPFACLTHKRPIITRPNNYHKVNCQFHFIDVYLESFLKDCGNHFAQRTPFIALFNANLHARRSLLSFYYLVAIRKVHAKVCQLISQ